MKWSSAAAFALLLLPTPAHADVVPPPFAPCVSKEVGERCFDAYGRAGHCEHEPRIGCVLDGSATTATASASALPSVPRAPVEEPPPRASSCGVGGTGESKSWLALAMLLALRSRSTRRRCISVSIGVS